MASIRYFKIEWRQYFKRLQYFRLNVRVNSTLLTTVK